MVGKRRFNGLDLAHALDLGAKTAYKAVAKPVEGTILTVIREAAAAAVTAAERDNNVESVLAAVVEAAEKSVAKTPSLLPILREAHVVDSGGQGLFRLFQGALEAARGRSGVIATAPAAAAGRPASRGRRPRPRTRPSSATRPSTSSAPVPAGRWTWPAIQAHLETLGESVLVAGDAHMVKVHVHNERPDAVVAYGLSLGALSRITIENLDGQAHDVREAKAAAFVGEAGRDRLLGRRDGHGGRRGRRRRAGRRGRAGHAAPDGRRRRRAVGRPGGDPHGHRRPLPGVRRVPDRPRRPEREPVHGRAARGGPGDPGGRAPDPAQQPERGPGRAPGRVDDGPADPHRAHPQRGGGLRGAVRAGPDAVGGRQRRHHDGRRPGAPDAAGHRGRAGRDGVRAQGQEGPDDRAGPRRRAPRRGQRPGSRGPGGVRAAGARLRAS